MPAKEHKINLLPQEEFETSTLGRILNWTLSSFRIIVILTEMAVMLAFLSRFWLDARLTDLNDLIKQKQAIIAAQSQFENQFRVVQKKTSIFASIDADKISSSDTISSIGTLLPGDVSLSSFSQEGKGMQITGTSASERSIAQLLSNLESDKIFENVFLANTEVNPDNQALLTFTIKLTFRKVGNS